MERPLHASARLGIAATFHLLLLWFVYNWLTFGPHYVGHSYFPRHNFLLEGAASATCLVLIFPVFWRGRPAQRAAAAVLSLVPAFLFALVVYYVIGLLFGVLP